ncbi:hypothetical protein LEP1GSC061_4166 [Leptospira wolffii serovar Khorat str. Khorat-H2]|nr:hypothetical protein LEP1GSC061_4166 [Leptospira wolffii serovar Khorat str. Khorat-H2]
MRNRRDLSSSEIKALEVSKAFFCFYFILLRSAWPTKI